MKILEIFYLTFILFMINLSVSAQQVKEPAPFGALPSERQLAWHEMEFYGFIHYTVNAFIDKEWGYGDEDPMIFNPSDLDTEQWARVAKEAGMKGLILTAKHHDGFCLWSSKYTEHSIKNSPVKNRNIVKELSIACKKYGIKFGIYLSPWDRNHAEYGKPAYIDYYKNQMQELLSENGDIFEVWFDGANGGDGYFGGAREKRIVDARTYYHWPEIHAIVRKLQPFAMIFSDAGPDCRWVGNEDGVAGITNWNTLNLDEFYPGSPRYRELTEGNRNGTHWIPDETDVSIRPGWFFHTLENDKVKTSEKLLEIYYNSVGRGSNLLLNLPPDKRGLIHENDIKSLKEMHNILHSTFLINYAKGAKVKASNFRGNSRLFAPENVLDENKDTYWSTDDNITTPELVISLKKKAKINRIKLKECIKLGQRVEAFSIEYWTGSRWKFLEQGTSIGYQRILCTKTVLTDKVRLKITKCPVCPLISEFGLYFQK
jgi:alpha-L-fucosidase